jgi:hypothetical protein
LVQPPELWKWADDFLKRREVLMSGQAGGRGYLIQALVSVLDALTNDREWTSITLEPNLTSDKVDILWQYPARRKVVQVKSSQNTISVPDVKSRAEELEASITADEYEIRLIGPVSQGVPTLGAHGKVRVPTPHPLNLDGLVHQAAHQLDRYLQTRRLGVQLPSMREMAVEALVTRLSVFATTGTAVEREAFDALLISWIGKVAEITILPPDAAVPRVPAFELRPQEAEILTRLYDARLKQLHLVRVDVEAGFAVLIDTVEIVDLHDAEAAMPYIEGVERLAGQGLLINPTKNGEVYHLSGDGRELARKLRGKCPWCKKSMDNAGKDTAQPPVWECRNSRCLYSTWHRDSRCPQCNKRPSEITDGGVGFTSFRCEDGHSFTTMPSRK